MIPTIDLMAKRLIHAIDPMMDSISKLIVMIHTKDPENRSNDNFFLRARNLELHAI